MIEVIKAENIPNLGDYNIDIYNAIIIPKGATNGDMIKALFPNGKVIECDEATGYEQMIDDKCSYCSWFDRMWWNSPYRKEN